MRAYVGPIRAARKLLAEWQAEQALVRKSKHGR
jgi:hypothetical protein